MTAAPGGRAPSALPRGAPAAIDSRDAILGIVARRLPRPAWQRWLIRLGALTLTTYAALTLLLMFFEKRLIYFPARGTPSPPSLSDGDACEDVSFTTVDGETLTGWWFSRRPVEGEGARPLVLWSHGNAGSIEGRGSEALRLLDAGVDVLLYDYRGYGRSTGTPSELGTYRDAAAAYAYATETRGVPASRLVLFGRSLGAAVTLQLASERPSAAVWLESAFTSLPDMAHNLYPWIPFVRQFTRTRYENLQKIAKLDRPLLYVHGSEDEIIPAAMGRALVEAAKANVPVTAHWPAAHHNDVSLVDPAKYWGWVTDWLTGLDLPGYKRPH